MGRMTSAMLVICGKMSRTYVVVIMSAMVLVLFQLYYVLNESNLNVIRQRNPPKPQLYSTGAREQKPNILFLLVDDLGFNDVGYHGKDGGSAIRTPTIDALAEQGVKLENYYVQPLCSPTRSQLMTGRYQIRMGIQHYLFEHTRPQCLPEDEVTLPQKLKEVGYSTHALGKWHLGFCRKSCLPTSRGFDTFFGLYTGGGDHWYYNRTMEGRPIGGHDLHDDDQLQLRNVKEYDGIYSAELFTTRAQQIIRRHHDQTPFFLYLAYKNVHFPIQAPNRFTALYKDTIVNGQRRTYAGMVSAVDESVRNLTQTMKATGVWNNTIIIFSTDNGGSLSHYGNNWPLRGGKTVLNEGGVRAVGFVSSPLLPVTIRGTVNRELIHISDWFPTIVQSIAGGQINGTKPLDGYDVWRSISEGAKSPRLEILHNIDPLYDLAELSADDYEFLDSLPGDFMFNPSLRAAIRVGDWKLLTGYSGCRHWRRPSESPGLIPVQTCPGFKDPIQLYNIKYDPKETCNVAKDHKDVVLKLLRRLQYYQSAAVPANFPPIDQRADPQWHGGFWVPYIG